VKVSGKPDVICPPLKPKPDFRAMPLFLKETIMKLRTTALAISALVPLLAGVPSPAAAQAPTVAPSEIATPRDMFEPLNRVMFGFNTLVVDTVVDPIAHLLNQVTPNFAQRIAANLYENISEPEFVFTNLLAGHFKDAGVSVGRFAVNSTIGLAGMFDAATPMGLERRTTEVSEAMCKVGITPGPYLVLPLIGPTNLFSGGLLGAALAAEWYALSLVSTALAAGDAIFDVSVSVASLRHVRDIPDDHQSDHYAVQQQDFWTYVKAGCAPTTETKTTVTSTHP
jgi:phospholipid-binding lipoprotein MlaA